MTRSIYAWHSWSVRNLSIWGKYLSMEIKCLFSFAWPFRDLIHVRVALFSFRAQVFASLNLHFQTSVTQHRYLMVHRGSFWWIQLHFLASLALHKVLQGPWWVDRWLQPSRDIYGILPSSIQLFGPTFLNALNFI